MLTVHHLRISQSERVVWLCEELQIPYELRLYDRVTAARVAPDEYKALHPAGTAPVITDGAVVLAESGAIFDYILSTYGKGQLTVTPGSPNFVDYLYWLHFGNGSLMPAILIDYIISLLDVEGNTVICEVMKARTDRAFAMLEKRLGRTRYLAGDELTAADIMALYPLTNMRDFAARDLHAFPHIRAYLARIGERPAYRRAMQRAEPGFAPLLS